MVKIDKHRTQTKKGARTMLKRHFINIMATGFGSGYSPIASGTAGTVVAVLLFGALFFFIPAAGSLNAMIGISVVLCIFSVWVADQACQLKLYGSGIHDPKEIVIDEIAGYSFALIGIAITPVNLILAFFLFRFFDILKPPPCNFLEKLPGGLGIVLDDIAAGILACLSLQLILCAAEKYLT